MPLRAAALTIAAQPLHFVAAVILESHSLDLFAWGLNGVGFLAASLAIWNRTDDDWDLAPAQQVRPVERSVAAIPSGA